MNQQQLIIFVVMVWDLVWKGLGMWKAAKNNHPKWFIAMLAINTLGILPIVYIKFFQKPGQINFNFNLKDLLPWKKHNHKH